MTTDPVDCPTRPVALGNETCYVRAQRMRAQICRGLLLAFAVSWATLVSAQEPPPPPAPSTPEEIPEQIPTPAAPISEETQISPLAPCLQPPPVVRWQDYQGPLKKVVGAFGRRLERKSVGTPHYKPGAVLCSLTFDARLRLFVADTFDPITFLDVAFNSAIDQGQNNQPAFGQGAAGYGKRFGYNFSLQASGEFFSDVVYSTIFKEDPRYYRLGYGSPPHRFIHAIRHTIIAKRENGGEEFNFAEWLGVASTMAVAYSYHTGRRPGLGPAAGGFAMTLTTNAGWNVLREFWPEVAHLFKLPFRDENAARPVPMPE